MVIPSIGNDPITVVISTDADLIYSQFTMIHIQIFVAPSQASLPILADQAVDAYTTRARGMEKECQHDGCVM